ncbi:triose-phosphate isomerase [Hydrogenophilus thiooxidans]|uniref:triose-phosphate isomerase n=1 Tax=Hydrogenophilus thiooxidans TaxID=2820326 RepID=UPI001C24AD2A|nr:triose-phosphate isomerase [Hydrogenophilus thiooxidans]
MKWVIGNWKSNGTWAQNEALLVALKALVFEKTQVGVCVPYPYLAQAQRMLQAHKLLWGAQNVSPFGPGAYTGEVHAEMLRDFGCRLTIVGHSERRQYFGETNAQIAEKIQRLNAVEITPIWCVGETLEERERGAWQEVLRRQIVEVVEIVGAPAVENVLIAYEPVWAIGTGRNATPEDVAAAHGWLRKVLSEVGARADLPILYGGSVKGSNAAELFAVEGCDGGLIGGASLSAPEFAAIVAAAEKE